jgi:hypothetical protein
VNHVAAATSGFHPDFDLSDPEWSVDPFPHYARLREHAPIHRSQMGELGFWVVSRHADCLAMLRDRRVSSDTLNVPEGFRRPTHDDPMAIARLDMRPFLFRDPPDHTRLRGLLVKAFTPKVVESLRDRTQRMVDELLDDVLDAGEVDLLEEFASPLPVRVICDLLGVPAEDWNRFRQWSDAMARGLDPDFLLSDDTVAARDVAVVQFAGYFYELLADRRKHLGDDLLSRLIQVEEEGSSLTEAEMLSTCILLLVAGHETAVILLSGGSLALLRHPDQMERFRTDPGVQRSAIEEMLRIVTPVQMTARAMTEDAEFGGVHFSEGDYVILLLASGNRDADQFEDPERFDITRTPNNHLGLGFGIHHCLGAPLARMESQVALATLVRRAPRMTLATDDVGYKSNIVMRGMTALPVSIHG